MKKLWRSGMIDKKVLKAREQEEYVRKLETRILFLKRALNQVYGMEECSKSNSSVSIERLNGVAYIPVELSDEDRDDYWLAQHKRDSGCTPLTPVQSAKKWGEAVKEYFDTYNKNRPDYDRYDTDAAFRKDK